MYLFLYLAWGIYTPFLKVKNMRQYIYILKLVLRYVGLIIYEPQITGFAIILNV